MGSAGTSDSVEGRRDGSALAGSLNGFFLERKRFILVAMMCLLVFTGSSSAAEMLVVLSIMWRMGGN